MNDKIKLLKLANGKISDNNKFMAFYLKKYVEFENISEQEMRSNLNCSVEDYYKLALCKAPEVNTNDFTSRLNNISHYTGITSLVLSTIIKRVHSVIILSENKSTSYLMAARNRTRKKDKTDDNDVNEDH